MDVIITIFRKGQLHDFGPFTNWERQTAIYLTLPEPERPEVIANAHRIVKGRINKTARFTVALATVSIAAQQGHTKLPPGILKPCSVEDYGLLVGALSKARQEANG